MIEFSIEASSGAARAGVLRTPHGEVLTPAFQPVATQATVKALSAGDVAASGARLLIMNTYHLWLRPGAETVAELGGLHAFSGWPHAITTDSGGFQAFSLAERTRIDEDGFEFSSHLDGQRLRLSPERAMEIQGLLGADIVMQLDVCPPADAPPEALNLAVDRTTRWAERCLAAKKTDQALFGIVQGGTDLGLRLRHAEALAQLPLSGMAIGGLSVGEPLADMYRTVREVAPALDAARPRYLMGVGTPRDLVEAMRCGIDLFDCVIPSRNARNGQLFVSGGTLTIKNATFARDPRPIEEGCACPACEPGYSRAYLRHLFLQKELSVYRFLTLHNLWYYQTLVSEAREAIVRGEYDAWSERARSAWPGP